MPVTVPFKTIGLFFIFIIYAILNIIKYLLFIPFLIRLFERLFNWGLTNLMFTTMGYSNITISYHHQDENFLKRVKVPVDPHLVADGDVILSTQAALIEYVYLTHLYSPVFTAVAIDEDTGDHGFRVLSGLGLVGHAMGIRHPIKVPGSDLLKLSEIKNMYVNR